MDTQNNKNRTVYCHFSFKRPKGENYGLFAVAFYTDFEGKNLTAQATRKLPLWQNHQFITAIQSYEHALYSIYVWQGIMIKNGISNVLLVTDNSTLAGWIENPKKNKAYTAYMNRAVENYRLGGSQEITLSIGLCEVRNYEKSYKFCREDKVINAGAEVIKQVDVKTTVVKKDVTGRILDDQQEVKVNKANVIDIDAAKMQYNTITELIKNEDDMNKPEIGDITEVSDVTESA